MISQTVEPSLLLYKYYNLISWIMYCKLGNFLEGFSFVKIISSQNVKISLSLTDVGNSCPSCKFETWQICLLT